MSMWGMGAILAGLLILGGQLPGLLISLHTGVIVSRSYGRPKISRDVDSARFWRLWKQRAAALAVPAMLIVGGALQTANSVRQIMANEAQQQAMSYPDRSVTSPPAP